jgi:hypothetical protein
MSDNDTQACTWKPDFICPHCGIHSRQQWLDLRQKRSNNQVLTVADSTQIYNIFQKIPTADLMLIAFCDSCKKFSLWIDSEMVYPESLVVAQPNEDLNDEIKQDYLEAASILQKSPRGAAALLRLAIQKLCKQIGTNGKDINGCIASLVAEGLPKKIQQALDALRVIGNQAVHPGVLNLKDDLNTATKLFKLVNLIANHFITEPKEVDEIFNSLPNAAKESIERRDAATKN